MYTDLLNLICGFVLGYATWNIVDIIRTGKQMKQLEKKSKVIQKLTKEIKDTLGIPNDMIHEANPLKAAYQTLTTRLNMPKEKCILTKNDSSLAIAYGHSCVIVLDRPEEGIIGVAIGVDKTTSQSNKDRQKELEDLTRLITNAEFGSSNFLRALALMIVAVSKAEKEKFSNVTRQIPHDML